MHKNGWQTAFIEQQHEPASAEGSAYAQETLAKLRACEGCRYH